MVKLIPCDATLRRRAKQRRAKTLSTSQSVNMLRQSRKTYLSCLILFLLSSLFTETLKRVAILIMTHFIAQIADRTQKPSSGVGFFEVGKKCRMVIRKIITLVA